MSGASRFGLALIIATLAASPAAAADLATPLEPLPPPPPTFFIHVGALGSFAQSNAQPAGGGVFTGISNIAIPPVYTLVVETGYYVTPNVAVTLLTAVPPVTHFKAVGLIQEPIFRSDLLGSARYGVLGLVLQYHFTQFGPLQPYIGAGGGFAINFGNISDGILQNVRWDQNFAFLVQAGTDYMFTPNWGVFIDAKKVWFATDLFGFATSPFTTLPLPTSSHVRVDPWVADVGITFKY